jgi:hypothetical protein
MAHRFATFLAGLLGAGCAAISGLGGLEVSDDAPDPGDAATEQATADAADGGGFCVGRPATVFCEDFDTRVLDASWSADPGTSLDTTHAWSKPNALLSRLTGGNGCQNAKASRKFATPLRSIDVDMRVRLGDGSGVFDAEWFTVVELRGLDSCALLLGHSGGISRVMVQGRVGGPGQYEDQIHFSSHLKIGTWHALRLHADVTGNRPRVRVDLDGTNVVPDASLDKCVWNAEALVALGLHCNDTGEVRIDDVLVDAH